MAVQRSRLVRDIGGGSYWAGRAVVRPIFGPWWTAPISGPPTFDSSEPRQSVKDTHDYIIFTSWIRLVWHSDITKFNFGQVSALDPLGEVTKLPAGEAYEAPPGLRGGDDEGADDRSGPLFPMSQGTLPWQPVL